MRVDLSHIYALTRIVNEGGGNDGIEQRGGDSERAIGREDGESLNVDIVGLLTGCWCGG